MGLTMTCFDMKTEIVCINMTQTIYVSNYKKLFDKLMYQTALFWNMAKLIINIGKSFQADF
jgi:hypothetical protein